MKNFTLLITIFAVTFIFSQVKTFACSCVQIENVTLEQEIKNKLKNDKAIFVGKVIEINNEPKRDNRLIKFQVEQFWKGEPTEEISISTEKEMNSCAIPFEKDESYLIFAIIYEGDLLTGLCMSDKEISRAAEELKILGEGVKPKKLKP